MLVLLISILHVLNVYSTKWIPKIMRLWVLSVTLLHTFINLPCHVIIATNIIISIIDTSPWSWVPYIIDGYIHWVFFNNTDVRIRNIETLFRRWTRASVPIIWLHIFICFWSLAFSYQGIILSLLVEIYLRLKMRDSRVHLLKVKLLIDIVRSHTCIT